jgi:hypothetical protein
MKQRSQKAILYQIVPGCQKVVQATQSSVKFNILKCSGNSKVRDGVGRNFEEVFFFIKNSTILGFIKTADAVQKASFSRSIGANDTQNFPFSQFKTNILKGDEIPKSQSQVFNFEVSFVWHWPTPTVDSERLFLHR